MHDYFRIHFLPPIQGESVYTSIRTDTTDKCILLSWLTHPNKKYYKSALLLLCFLYLSIHFC